MRMELQANVERGARLLDREIPGWEQRIDLNRLDIRSPLHCALGQLFGGQYQQGAQQLGVVGAGAEHGFFVNGLGNYPALTEEWRSLITARRQKVLEPA